MRINYFLLAAFGLWIVSAFQVKGQNFISNGDFEAFTLSPTGNGQVDRATGWQNVVVSADYMNTTYSCWSPEIGGAYSGTGFVGFALYGNPASACEAPGQNISGNPLVAGSDYEFGAYLKMTSGGSYNQVCGGMALYGYSAIPPIGMVGVHASTHPTAELLWTSPIISSTAWNFFSGSFTPTQNTNYIVLTISPIPSCAQYIFVDSAYIIPVVTLDAHFTRFASMQENGGVRLEWETPVDDELAYFSIEHSSDGEQFKSIGTVVATDRPTGVGWYEFFHSRPMPGENHYRLRMLGVNGEDRYSEVLTEIFDGTTVASVFPSPAQKGSPMFLEAWSDGGDISVSFSDFSGKLVLNQAFTTEPGISRFELQTESLLPGIYLCRINMGGDIQTRRIQILR